MFVWGQQYRTKKTSWPVAHTTLTNTLPALFSTWTVSTHNRSLQRHLPPLMPRGLLHAVHAILKLTNSPQRWGAGSDRTNQVNDGARRLDLQLWYRGMLNSETLGGASEGPVDNSVVTIVLTLKKIIITFFKQQFSSPNHVSQGQWEEQKWEH